MFLSFLVSAVAFSSWNITQITTDNCVIFSNVVFNEGRGYDNTTGYFTSPSDGVYAFNAQICTTPSKNRRLLLRSSVSGKVNNMEGTIEHTENASGCTSVYGLIQLYRGNQVYLYSQTSMLDIYQDTGYYGCSFMGIRISD